MGQSLGTCERRLTIVPACQQPMSSPATGKAGALGAVSASGSVTLPGFIVSGTAAGTLTLTTAGESAAGRARSLLKLTGPTEKGFGPFPTTLSCTDHRRHWHSGQRSRQRNDLRHPRHDRSGVRVCDSFDLAAVKVTQPQFPENRQEHRKHNTLRLGLIAIVTAGVCMPVLTRPGNRSAAADAAGGDGARLSRRLCRFRKLIRMRSSSGSATRR